ncbi:hypothetical protein [Klebsiella pneumoniae]|uniref:hypothetical protein n=1 Tax=Klebsiella pneumoniae TaxID=573 RepID=UPI001EE7FDCA|nr:hypothetical protein [Klebsiella pneumoniae]MCG5617260.1 hypothetical protein [Klebsiella pneumoniae]
MTDITELAQRMKAAANTTADAIDRLKAFPGDELIDLSQHQGEQVDIDITTLNEWYELSSPANIIALVEALEKAQRANGHLREQSAEWERKAISNFEDCAEMSARIEELESQRKLAFTSSNRWADKFREAEKRIAELESRTVKLPELCVGVVQGGHAVMVPYPAGHWFNKTAILEMLAAAGIKVEAE